MSQSEIADANRLIRPILAGQLSLCRAVYAPSDEKAPTEHIERVLDAFDRLIRAAQSVAQPQQVEGQSNDG